LQRWLAACGITEGAIFRAVNKGGAEVAMIVKCLASAAGLIYCGRSYW